MFRKNKTRITSDSQVEESLEVKVVPQKEEFVAVDFIKLQGHIKSIYYGTLVDYDGKEYEFQWDNVKKEICKISGSGVTQFLLDSAFRVLKREFPELDIIIPTLKKIEEEIEKLRNLPQPSPEPTMPFVEIPTPLDIYETLQEEIIEEEPETDVDGFLINDDTITQNARKFLEENKDNPDLAYLNL